LPAEAGSRRALMRRFNAHRHVVATLLAGQRRDRSSALAHAVPAFWYRPRVLLNRGFVKILLRALAG
jgi:hypothetical protein